MANETVCAIGPNIFPSIPTKAKIGRYTIKIIISPKAVEMIKQNLYLNQMDADVFELALGDYDGEG